MDNSDNTVKKKLLNLMASDSVEENNLYETNKSSSADNDKCYSILPKTDLQVTKHKTNSKNKSLRKIIDSEFKEDTQTSESNIPQMVAIGSIIERYQPLMNLESKEEKQNEKIEKKIEAEDDRQKSKSDDLTQTIYDTINPTAESILIDSESEEDEQNETIENTFTTSKKTSENKVAKKSVKKRKDSIKVSKNEAMRQIYSESQRLLRRTEISLPYHRPKQRTLQEFLNRKKISAALPKASSTAAKLKMSSAIVSEVLAEKEKEAELFYKSSDSEDNVQQSVPLVSKDIKISSITNEREFPIIDIDRTCIRDFKRIETSARDNKKEMMRKDLNASICQVLLEKHFYEIDHQAIKLTLTNNSTNNSLTNNNINPNDRSDALLHTPQQNECNQNLSKLSLSKQLFDIRFKSWSSDEINLKEQDAAEGVVETIITSLNKKKCYNDEKKSKITMAKNQISKVQDNSEVINGRDKNRVIEAMKISGTLSNSINNKEIIETFQSENDVTNNICSNSDESTVKDRNHKKKGKYSEINDISPSFVIINDTQSRIQGNSLIDECEKFDGHVQSLSIPKFTDKISTSRKKLSALVSNSKVTLRGSPGMTIDLTNDAKLNAKGVNTLLDRFFGKHNTKKQNNNKSEEITVVHSQNMQNGFLPIKEALPYRINTDNSELNKPGTKLIRLKEALKLQMTLKRNKEWKQKEIELQAQKEVWNWKKKSDLDNQQKAELDFELNDSEESELEENDICINDKKKSKCLFANDEAEVTDNENSSTEETCSESDTDHIKHNKHSTSFKYRKEYTDNDVNEIETNQEKDDNETKEEGKEENKESLDVYMENGNESDFKDDDNVDAYKIFNIIKNKHERKTKQLIEELQDDSNINSSFLQNGNSHLNMTNIDPSDIHCENNDWTSENESNMSACQHVEITTRSRICKTPLSKTSMLDLVSPVTQLSVLNITLDSNKKHLSQKRERLVDKYKFLSMENNTQNDESFEHICNIGKKSILKKKLFDDVGETLDDEYLMRLCSGKFKSTQTTDLNIFMQSNSNEPQLCPSESECRGNSNTKSVDVKQSKNPKINDKMLQDIKLTLNEDSNNFVNHAREVNKVSAMDSELKLRITSSDDEDEDTFLKSKKCLTKRLNLSDSEEEHSQFFDEDDTDNEETEKQCINYDSEENEIIVVPERNIKKLAADFMEEEAELSESNWDSADEDEKDLDKLEFEEADNEHIDEHEVKNQLKKIHMKQILDQDKKEVRLLKELLFEDGDLHTNGLGRERKFKWRNIDKLGNNMEISKICDENDGWVDIQEDEEEAKWSKLRQERDKFLEKYSNNEIEDELCDSQIFKLGLEAVRKIKDNESQIQDISLDKIDPSGNMDPIMPQNIIDFLNESNIGNKSHTIQNVTKKYSLLTRGEESLARIASLAKQGDSASAVVNTRKFVFPHIDQDTNNIFKKETEITEDLDLQIKFGKRKLSNMSSISRKRRK